MDEKYWLWLGDANTGPFSANQIARMALDEPTDENAPSVNRDTLYFSERANEWRPLWRLPEEWHEDGFDHANQARECGLNHLEYLGSGCDAECEACKAHECQIVPADPTPPLPIPGCSCNPWSCGIYVVIDDERAVIPFQQRRKELEAQREYDRISREAHAATLKQQRRKKR